MAKSFRKPSIVAASDSSEAAKRNADYFCNPTREELALHNNPDDLIDGPGDEVAIQAALDSSNGLAHPNRTYQLKSAVSLKRGRRGKRRR